MNPFRTASFASYQASLRASSAAAAARDLEEIATEAAESREIRALAREASAAARLAFEAWRSAHRTQALYPRQEKGPIKATVIRLHSEAAAHAEIAHACRERALKSLARRPS